MKIEVWSDYVCPFCYIGKRRLEEAIESTNLTGQTEVVFKAFQLDPNTPVSANGSAVEGLTKKFGISQTEAERMMANVAEQAKTVGLNYDVEGMKVANTYNAHRLAKLAEQEGKADAVSERLLEGHFVKGEALGDESTLVAIAEEVGISKDRVQQMLQSDEFSNEVKKDIGEAGQIGVQGVPFFVINRKYAISGAQPAQAFEEALRKVAAEEGIQPQLKVLGKEGQGLCTDDNCEI
ncbi:DsbA family oxidoreductase [Sporosarcina thermotolerans]|uniref:DsbA family oxidoreductase n=1 Tax=Sporosarcina thermotolerans TaxID=633404 RepID=A0AAW9ACS9_9BACL|nr:DsbA family oxidoreductase [Sporosarcina thermotolerans]MDW0118009.1 DsbA family oxidoreductase [Sporosarcina thermotolerans]WHT49080.1 DsbA family oxidoreductase [Sporosarcina thermotolerans]